jgi:hypothetical protein
MTHTTDAQRRAREIVDRTLPLPRPVLVAGIATTPVAFTPEHVHVAEDRDQ